MKTRFLIACHVLELLALSVWAGGLVVIVATVIPAVFNSFGMEPGGRFLTKVFDGYNQLVLIAIVLLLIGAAGRFWLRRDRSVPVLSRAEGGLLAAMVSIALLITFVLGPQSVALQERAFAAQGDTAKRAAYEDFFKTHHLVRGLYLLNLGLAIVLLAVKVKRLTGEKT